MLDHLTSGLVGLVLGAVLGLGLTVLFEDPLKARLSTMSTRFRDPDGICSGGNGLSMRPRDLLSFGVLYLQDGMWGGERVLPAGWPRKASARHVRKAVSGEWNGKELVPAAPDAEADSGYGYQFWTTEDGIYSASGIFGQECMIFPEQGGVVVVTGAMGEGTYHDLPAVLRDAFRTAFDMRGDAAETEALDRRFPQAREPERCAPRRCGPGSGAATRSSPTSRACCPSAWRSGTTSWCS